MDIAYYLSELLGELGRVNVPGLGCFTQQKIDGYYKSNEGKFYPPTAEVHYSENFTEDDILAEYIAEKKKISLASAQYFIEKYSSKIKVDVLMEDVQIANLGWIYPQGNGLNFKRSNSPVIDPAYYGYPKVELQQPGTIAVPVKVEANTAPQDEPLLPPVFHDTPVAEPETVSIAHHEPLLPPVLHDTPVEESEAVSIPHPEPELTPVSADLPITEPEVLSEPHQEPVSPPVLYHEPVIEPGAVHDELLLPPADELVPVADPVDLIVPQYDPFEVKEEHTKAPMDFGSQMEDYLRELEAGAYISGSEIHEPVMSTVSEPILPEPVVELPKQEIVPEQLIELPKPEPVHEPVIETPKIEPVPEPITLVPFPEHIPASYTPDTELQHYILDETPVASQPLAYTSAKAASPQEEEEFVFDGKGYDNVDNRRQNKGNYLWLWITLGIIVLLAGAGFFLYIKHEQALKLQMAEADAPKPVVKNDTSKKVVAANALKDTLKSVKDSAKNHVIVDTTEKVAQLGGMPSAIDSAKIRYELIGVNAKSSADADHRVANYKSLGAVNAHIVTGPVYGEQIKISLGTYADRKDAINARQAIIKAGKIRNITIIKFNPTK
jgi:hypothetical protein